MFPGFHRIYCYFVSHFARSPALKIILLQILPKCNMISVAGLRMRKFRQYFREIFAKIISENISEIILKNKD